MSFHSVRRAIVAIGTVAGLGGICASTTLAQPAAPPGRFTTQTSLTAQGPHVSITLGDVLSRGPWRVAREALIPSPADTVAAAHRPRRIELELFTPGDIGAAVSVHW